MSVVAQFKITLEVFHKTNREKSQNVVKNTSARSGGIKGLGG